MWACPGLPRLTSTECFLRGKVSCELSPLQQSAQLRCIATFRRKLQKMSEREVSELLFNASMQEKRQRIMEALGRVVSVLSMHAVGPQIVKISTRNAGAAEAQSDYCVECPEVAQMLRNTKVILPLPEII